MAPQPQDNPTRFFKWPWHDKNWRVLRKRLLQNRVIQKSLTCAITGYLYLVYYTNRWLKESSDPKEVYKRYNPFIITFWHGSHIMAPFLRPAGERVVAMFSRSVDAELNAKVAEKLGLDVVRGSGGRPGTDFRHKGGVRALLSLNKALKTGYTSSMIADVPHGLPRVAGRGIILLAKISGRPIIPCIYAFSRYRVLKKTWDKTIIPLPFGRCVCLMGEPIFVDSEAQDADIEEKRLLLTERMNNLTDQAYALLEKRYESK